MRRRREARCQHQVGALGQKPDIGAVLIHQRQLLDAPLLGPVLVDEHDAAVEIALLAGRAFVDLVGDDVGNPPPIFRRGLVLLAGHLLLGVHVPEAEFGFQTAVALPGHPAGHQIQRADLLPALELRRVIGIGDALDERSRIDRREQPAALEIVGDHLRHTDTDFGVAGRAGDEIRDRDRLRRKLTFGNGDPLRRLRKCAANRRGRDHTERGHSRNDLPAAQAERHSRQPIFVSHRFNLAHM